MRGKDFRLRTSVAVAVCCCAVSCGGGDNPSNPDPVPVRGGERLAWNQAADSVQAIRGHSFRLYVDGSLATLAEVRCSDRRSKAGYECSGRLPNMPPGEHVLELTSVLNGVESPRSSRLPVRGSSQTTVATVLGVNPGASAREAAATCAPARSECHDVRLLASDLDSPTDLTPTPDGRVFFIEGGTQVRVIENGALLPDPALSSEIDTRLVGLAADTGFDRTRTVFVAWTEETRDGGTQVNVTRYREVGNSLGEGAQIVTGLPVPLDATVPLGVDADGLLYVALPGGADLVPGRTAPAPFSGAVLRYDRDGLTPRTNPRPSPVISFGYTQPSALAVDLVNQRVWLGGMSAAGSSVSSFAMPSDGNEPWPLSPSLVGAEAFDGQNQAQTPGPALAFDRTTKRASAALVVSAGLYLANPTPSGELALLERLPLDEGVPLGVAGAIDGAWYVAARAGGSGAGTILKLQRAP